MMKYYYSTEKNRTYVSIIDNNDTQYGRIYFVFFPPKYVMVDCQIEIKNENILSLINGDRLKINHELNDIIIKNDYIKEIRKNNVPYRRFKHKHPF